MIDNNGIAAGHATVYESGLLSAADTSESASGTIRVSAPDGLTSLVVGGLVLTNAQLAALATTPQSIDTGEGTLTLTGYDAATGNLSYVYTLHGPVATNSIDAIAVTVTGPGGTATGTLNINIVDNVTPPTITVEAPVVTNDTRRPLPAPPTCRRAAPSP